MGVLLIHMLGYKSMVCYSEEQGILLKPTLEIVNAFMNPVLL